MRVLKVLGGVVLAILLLALCALAAAWWWAGTEGSAQWALAQVAQRQPLVAENVTGSLRHGLKAVLAPAGPAAALGRTLAAACGAGEGDRPPAEHR